MRVPFIGDSWRPLGSNLVIRPASQWRRSHAVPRLGLGDGGKGSAGYLRCCRVVCRGAQDFESADTIVKGQTQPALNELGKALSDPKLARGTFLIAGHTDAKEMAQWRKASRRRLLTKKPRLSEPAGLPLPISTLPV